MFFLHESAKQIIFCGFASIKDAMQMNFQS
jgi:hypothetical protein